MNEDGKRRNTIAIVVNKAVIVVVVIVHHAPPDRQCRRRGCGGGCRVYESGICDVYIVVQYDFKRVIQIQSADVLDYLFSE